MSQYCEKCGRTLNENQFYTSRNIEKYPNGLLNICKKCATMHVDNWNPDTFLWLLEDIDVPFVKEWWDEILQKMIDEGKKIGPMTILGRYMSKMRLRQWAEYRWKDNERLIEKLQNEKILSMKAQGYDEEEISNQLAIDRTPAKPKNLLEKENKIEEVGAPEYYDTNDDDDEEFSQQLTEEDKTYLKLKWGKNYRASEWIRMEQLYTDMMESYDIQGAATKDSLIMICKASLKMNQLMDCGDIDGAQKVAKVYDSLLRSANLTAAQNKANNGDYVDSIGEIIAICEERGFFEQYYIDKPNDMVDKVIQDMQHYTSTLVKEEMNLGNMIDAALKGIEKDRLSEESLEIDDEDEENVVVFDEYQDMNPVTEEDYEEFSEMQEEQEQANLEFFKSLSEEGGE